MCKCYRSAISACFCGTIGAIEFQHQTDLIDPLIAPFTFAPVSGGTSAPSGIGVPRQRVSRSIGLALTLLLHVLGVWMLIARDPLVKPPAPGSEESITYVAPMSDAARAITPPVPPRPQPKDPPKEKATPKPKPKPLPKTPPVAQRIRPRPPARVTPPTTAATEPLAPAPTVAPQPDVAQTPPAPAEDFSARLEANRKRRAEAQAQAPSLAQTPTESESERANRIARENIAFSQRNRGPERGMRDQTGGVFEVRNMGLHRGEFAFHGWNPTVSRNSTQVISVEQGSEIDIETAIITRMIAFIRTQRTGEFTFDSKRLGRLITMHAEPAYEAELRQFLMKEFFPNYVRTGLR